MDEKSQQYDFSKALREQTEQRSIPLAEAAEEGRRVRLEKEADIARGWLSRNQTSLNRAPRAQVIRALVRNCALSAEGAAYGYDRFRG